MSAALIAIIVLSVVAVGMYICSPGSCLTCLLLLHCGLTLTGSIVHSLTALLTHIVIISCRSGGRLLLVAETEETRNELGSEAEGIENLTAPFTA